MDDFDPKLVSDLKIPQLKSLIDKLNKDGAKLKKSGTRRELIDRIISHSESNKKDVDSPKYTKNDIEDTISAVREGLEKDQVIADIIKEFLIKEDYSKEVKVTVRNNSLFPLLMHGCGHFRISATIFIETEDGCLEWSSIYIEDKGNHYSMFGEVVPAFPISKIDYFMKKYSSSFEFLNIRDKKRLERLINVFECVLYGECVDYDSIVKYCDQKRLGDQGHPKMNHL